METVSGVHQTLQLTRWIVTLHLESFSLILSLLVNRCKFSIHFGLELGKLVSGTRNIIVALLDS